MSRVRRLAALYVLSTAMIGCLLPARSAQAQVASAITVSWEIPVEINDPANLQEAAQFAWSEFIALTWPAMPQGPTTFPRGQPHKSGKYGDAGPTGQVVWETFRHKVETFPGQGTPNGYDASAADLGFSAKPQYVYLGGNYADGTPSGIPANGLVPPLSGLGNPSVPPFNNLDEVTQITLNSMYAGAADPRPFLGTNQDTKQTEKILFEAKVNEVIYKYAAQPRNMGGQPYAFYDSGNPIVGSIGKAGSIKYNSVNYAETGDSQTYPPPYIVLPSSNPSAKQVGSIEIKASFRRINTKLEDASRYYTAPVRYYVGKVENDQQIFAGFVDSNDPKVNEVWGLTSLHIIQKTPNAPTFVYATFGHIHNILDRNGIDVEEPDGTTKPQYLVQDPFLPSLVIKPSTANPLAAQQVFLGAGQSNTNSPQLYYHNIKGKEVIFDQAANKPYTGPVNINRRIFPIPPTITAANRAAHEAIRKVNNRAVWLNYRLVNVQARPLDLQSIPPGEEPTFFLANEVVETNTSLQRFSGSLNSINGTISNYVLLGPSKGQYVKNTFVAKGAQVASYNMGGCMGCHGSQGQKQGGDFSVLMANGRVPFPEIIQADEEQEKLIRALSSKYLAVDPGQTRTSPSAPAKHP